MRPNPWQDAQANISIMFTEFPLEQRPAQAAAAGFSAIECWWPFDTATPSPSAVEEFATAIEDAGIHLRALNFYAGDMPGGERGLLSNPDRRVEFDDAVEAAVSLGARLHVEAFNALYGNRLDGFTADEQDDAARRALTSAASAAAGIGALVLLEPVSGVPSYPLKRAADVLAVMATLPALDNVKLLADLYHLTVNGEDLEAFIADHVERIGHVQIADAPGRHEPGTGGIDVSGLVQKLVDGGYSGHIGLEYSPSGATRDGLGWLKELASSFRV